MNFKDLLLTICFFLQMLALEAIYKDNIGSFGEKAELQYFEVHSL